MYSTKSYHNDIKHNEEFQKYNKQKQTSIQSSSEEEQYYSNRKVEDSILRKRYHTLKLLYGVKQLEQPQPENQMYTISNNKNINNFKNLNINKNNINNYYDVISISKAKSIISQLCHSYQNYINKFINTHLHHLQQTNKKITSLNNTINIIFDKFYHKNNKNQQNNNKLLFKLSIQSQKLQQKQNQLNKVKKQVFNLSQKLIQINKQNKNKNKKNNENIIMPKSMPEHSLEFSLENQLDQEQPLLEQLSHELKLQQKQYDKYKYNTNKKYTSINDQIKSTTNKQQRQNADTKKKSIIQYSNNKKQMTHHSNNQQTFKKPLTSEINSLYLSPKHPYDNYILQISAQQQQSNQQLQISICNRLNLQDYYQNSNQLNKKTKRQLLFLEQNNNDDNDLEQKQINIDQIQQLQSSNIIPIEYQYEEESLIQIDMEFNEKNDVIDHQNYKEQQQENSQQSQVEQFNIISSKQMHYHQSNQHHHEYNKKNSKPKIHSLLNRSILSKQLSLTSEQQYLLKQIQQLKNHINSSRHLNNPPIIQPKQMSFSSEHQQHQNNPKPIAVDNINNKYASILKSYNQQKQQKHNMIKLLKNTSIVEQYQEYNEKQIMFLLFIQIVSQ